MRRYVIISEFNYGAQRIKPPGEWTPPSEIVASKLISAGCLRVIVDKPEPVGPPTVNAGSVDASVKAGVTPEGVTVAGVVSDPDPPITAVPSAPPAGSKSRWGRGNKSRGK